MFDVVPHLLHEIGARADHVGHVLLEPEEIVFAGSKLGTRFLVPINPERRLYKPTRKAREQLAI